MTDPILPKNTFISKWPGEEIDILSCFWYHGYNFTQNVSDVNPDYYLDDDIDKFLLPEDMTGKSFLDIGCASGFFSFEMEKRGAEKITSFDLASEEAPDEIPYFNLHDTNQYNSDHRYRLKKSYWYAHEKFQSKANAFYGNVLNMPEELGQYDVTFLGSILQHLRDPFLAIQEADKHTKDTLVICEACCDSDEPMLLFQAEPDSKNPQFWTWWRISPSFIVNALKVFGYTEIKISEPFDLRNIRCGFDVRSITVSGKKTINK